MKESIKITIGRASTWFRPYSCEGVEVNSIKFYNSDGVIIETQRGYLEDDAGSYSSKDITEIEIARPVRRMKENFSRKENFVKSAEKKYYEKDRKVDLYIHKGEAKVTFIKDEHEDMGRSIHFYKRYSIEFDSGLKFEMKVFERVEDNEWGTKVKAMEEKLKAMNINIWNYDLERLMKHFTIKENTTEKEVKI